MADSDLNRKMVRGSPAPALRCRGFGSEMPPVLHPSLHPGHLGTAFCPEQHAVLRGCADGLFSKNRGFIWPQAAAILFPIRTILPSCCGLIVWGKWSSSPAPCVVFPVSHPVQLLCLKSYIPERTEKLSSCSWDLPAVCYRDVYGAWSCVGHSLVIRG